MFSTSISPGCYYYYYHSDYCETLQEQFTVTENVKMLGQMVEEGLKFRRKVMRDVEARIADGRLFHPRGVAMRQRMLSRPT